MRIIHILWAFPIGGTETMLVELINRQSIENNVMLIIINNYYNDELISKISGKAHVVKLNRSQRSKSLLFLLRLWCVMGKFHADAIHCHNENISVLFPFFRNKAFLTVHALSFDPRYFTKYKKVFAISKTVQDYVHRESGENARLVYNGIIVTAVRLKKEYSYKCFRVLQVSRMDHTIKGQDILINAVKYLVTVLNVRNISLDFIGGGPSSDYLKNLVSENQLEQYVNFCGERDKYDIYNSICDYNLLVQPSIHEGLGLTIIEGMVARVPVLVSDIPGPMEVIRHGSYGSFFKSGDHIDCARKIQDIISGYNLYTSDARMEEIRNYAVLNFDIEVTSETYLSEYNG